MARTVVAAREKNKDEQATKPDHFHRWVIEEANGPTSGGVCKICGASKMFKNWLSDGDFITNEEHRSAA